MNLADQAIRSSNAETAPSLRKDAVLQGLTCADLLVVSLVHEGWSRAAMVELLTRYSNPAVVNDLHRTEQAVRASLGKHTGTDAAKLHRTVAKAAASPKPKKKRKYLSDDQARQLVADWNGGRGSKQKELAKKYDVALATVERIIKRHRGRSS